MLKEIGEELRLKLKDGRGKNLYNTIKKRIFKGS